MVKLILRLWTVRTFKPKLGLNAALNHHCLASFLLLAFSCSRPTSKNIMVVWKDNDAVGISIPESLVTDVSKSVSNHSLRVAVQDSDDAIAGSYIQNNHSVVFTPTAALAPGLTYMVTQNHKRLGTVQVPFAKNEHRPKVLGIYPLADTLPENQLKIHLEFSKPMQRGQSLDYVKLINSNGDTIRNAFLNMQPELWDTTGKILTLWLGPGAARNRSAPNQKLHDRLKRAGAYKLLVAMNWKDNRGMKLFKFYSKKFFVGRRLEKTPDINNWQIGSPKAGSVQPLNIRFPAPMDHYILLVSIQVLDSKGQLIKGHTGTRDNDKIWQFTPEKPWKDRHYTLKVAGGLEDLAGNNLNHAFSPDSAKHKQRNEQFYTRMFRISL